MLSATKMIYSVHRLLKKMGIGRNPQKDERVIAMQEKLHELGGVDFKIEIHPDGSWSAESANIDGIITGGSDAKEIDATIKDAVLTYFHISPSVADDTLLRAPNEPVMIRQCVWATQ